MNLQRFDAHSLAPLATVAELRALELKAHAQGGTPLMILAGAAVARLARAVAPHARRIWLACGPGNNGGDGLEAARHLHQAGFEVYASVLADPAKLPAEARAAAQRAQQAGVRIGHTTGPDGLMLDERDLCIDALLGIGSRRPPQGVLLACVQILNRSAAPTLSVDLPSGLQADTGHGDPSLTVKADHTLSLLRLKPGLFTGIGRDVCGQLWHDSLGTEAASYETGLTVGCPAAPPKRPHASHKGRHGDVAVVGGEPGMQGASVLAANAALHAGAGRVYWSPLGPASEGPCPLPDCIQRDMASLSLESLTVVAGCGGGMAIRAALPALLERSARLVLDADALNAIAVEPMLDRLLAARSERRLTVITPHPQEAARLLQTSTAEIQQDRLSAARALAHRWPGCIVVLKGSGTVVAQNPARLHINTSGNARLAIAGTGDVLAGLLGSRLQEASDAFEACCRGVWEHGWQAQRWPADQALTASALARGLTPPAPEPNA